MGRMLIPDWGLGKYRMSLAHMFYQKGNSLIKVCEKNRGASLEGIFWPKLGYFQDETE